MIANMINNRKLDSVEMELLIRSRKLNISLVFITQSYFVVPKNIRLNTTHYSLPKKRELQQIVINHSSNINTKDFINIYRQCTAKPYCFLVDNTTVASHDSLKFRKILFKYNKNHKN